MITLACTTSRPPRPHVHNAEHYHIVFNRSAHGISFIHLLANGAASVLYMRKIYTAYNAHVAHGTPFFEALAEQKLDRFWRHSKTLTDIFYRVNEGAPLFDTNLSKDVLPASDNELEEAMLKLLFQQPSFKIENHLMLTAPDNYSPVHMAGGMGRWMSMRALRLHCEEQIKLFPERAAAIRSALRTGVNTKSTYANRTALHLSLIHI